MPVCVLCVCVEVAVCEHGLKKVVKRIKRKWKKGLGGRRGREGRKRKISTGIKLNLNGRNETLTNITKIKNGLSSGPTQMNIYERDSDVAAEAHLW